MKFRLYGWTDVIDEAGEKWEKYAIVKEWTITYETSKREILDMVEAVKDGNVDIVIDKERDSCLRAADFDRFVEMSPLVPSRDQSAFDDQAGELEQL